MSFESTLRSHLVASATLVALVGDRITPMIREESVTTLPSITYMLVNYDRLNNFDGPDSGLANVRVQIDAWGRSYGSVIAVADAIRAQMVAGSSSLKNVVMEVFADDYESDTRLYRRMQEFSCWYKF